MTAEGELSAALTLRRGGLSRVGAERIALVEAIAQQGSISAAARQAGLSYKGAWDAVQALNNLFDTPLVVAASGGRSGGAAEVTPRGHAVIAAFRRVEREIAAALARIEDAPEDAGLFWSLGMKTSARNAFRGRVTAVVPGAVNGEVVLDLGGGVEMVSVLTLRSIADLGLEAGRPAVALVKSSFVILAKGQGLRTSARNQLTGVVLSRDDGAVNSEVAVDLGGAKTLVASLTVESARALDLRPGDRVTALIKAPHVILAVE